MIDLHLHLLPGVDDGPADEAASLEHAERLVHGGVTEATVTPHVGHHSFPLDVATIAGRVAELQAALDRAALPLRLHAGGEIHPAGATTLGPAELEAVAHGPAGARWVLLEVPFAGIDDGFVESYRHIRRHGFGCVIAHPERARGILSGGLRRLRPLLTDGAVLQTNVCSLMGRHGEEAQEAGTQLVRSGLTYVLASDGHGGRRAHTLAAAPEQVRITGGSAVRAWQLTEANPRFLLRHGLPSRPAAPTAARARRRSSQRRVAAARRAAQQVRGGR